MNLYDFAKCGTRPFAAMSRCWRKKTQLVDVTFVAFVQQLKDP